MSRVKKPTSTIERWIQKPGYRAGVARDYKKLILSELVLAIMAEDEKSIRGLASELGVSKTVIQNWRCGEQRDIMLSNFLRLTQAYGFRLVLEKGGRRIIL